MEYNVQLNKLSTYIYRGKQPKYATEGIPVINQKAIQWDTFDKSVLKYHDENKKVDKRHFIKKNDVLINSTGTGTVGRVYHINYEPDLMFADSHITIVRTNEELLMSRFLYYQMRTTQFQAMILNEFLAGSTGQVEFNKSMIEKLPINVPSISYQYKVVNILSKLDKKIETNKKIIANLEEISQTLFKRWFVDFEFPDKNGNPYKSSGGQMVDSELGEMPKNWKVDELGTYIKIKSGKRPKIKVDNKDSENVVPVIGASKIMGYTNDYLYNEKIIIIGRVGTHGVIQRFSTRTWPSDNTFVITSDFESIIYQFLKSIDYVSLNRGSTQPLLSQKDIKNTKVVMPTNENLLSEYQKENNHIFKMIVQKNIENQKLTQLRDSLLPKLMSGELEIPDDIEVNEDELSI